MSLITLEEAKIYLRQTSSDDDALITSLINSAEQATLDAARLDSFDDCTEAEENALRPGVYYVLAYMYEHREDPDFHAMTLTLRSILFGAREAAF